MIGPLLGSREIVPRLVSSYIRLTKLGKGTNSGVSLCPPNIAIFLSVHVEDIKMVREKEHLGPTWTILRREIDLEDPTPWLNQEYLGCTQREAEADHRAVQARSRSLPTNHHH